MLQFNFDAQKGETPASVAQKRALVAQILGTAKSPSNVGEGFSAIGDGIVANVLGGRAAEAEKAGQASADDTFAQLVASITGQGAATPSYTPQAATASPSSLPSVSPFEYTAAGLPRDPDTGYLMAEDDPRYAEAVRLYGNNGGSADASYIRQGLINRGLPEHVADAFLLNMQDESGLNPGINEASPTVPGSRGGFGLYQLTGPRRVAYEQYAQQLGVDPSNVDAQLDFMMSELQGPEARAYQSIMAAPDTGSAAAAIVNDFLRPAEEHRARRAAQYTGGAPTQVAQGPDLAMLMEAASNPWLSDSQKSVINSMIAQQMQQQDPAYQLGLEKLGLEVAGMRNPQPDPGFRVLTAEEAAKMNLPEGAYQVGPDNKVYEIGGGGTSVNVNLGDGAPGLGKLSTDYGYVLDPATSQPKIDPTTGLPTAAPVPGSPAAIAAEQAASAAAQGIETEGTYADIVTEDIGRALTLLEQDPTFTTGMFGVALGNWKGSNADRLDQLLNTVRSNVAFDRLQLMRESSPTGGALGSVTENELKLLESAIGSLERSNPDDLAYNLKRVQEIYDRVMQKAAAYPNASQFGFGGGAKPAGGQSGPVDIDALLEKYQ